MHNMSTDLWFISFIFCLVYWPLHVSFTIIFTTMRNPKIWFAGITINTVFWSLIPCQYWVFLRIFRQILLSPRLLLLGRFLCSFFYLSFRTHRVDLLQNIKFFSQICEIVRCRNVKTLLWRSHALIACLTLVQLQPLWARTFLKWSCIQRLWLRLIFQAVSINKYFHRQRRTYLIEAVYRSVWLQIFTVCCTIGSCNAALPRVRGDNKSNPSYRFAQIKSGKENGGCCSVFVNF